MSITYDMILHTAINPALLLLPRAMDSDAARVQLLATGKQESGFTFRIQKTQDPYNPGPARGFWQNERAEVNRLMTNLATRDHARALCKAQGVPFDCLLVHDRLAFNDVLAAGFARLILWADYSPLPRVDASHEEAWLCYLRTWRPGKPRREPWDAYHAEAQAQVITKESP